MTAGAVLVIDQGTTSTRAVVFGDGALPLAMAQEEFPQFYSRPGWVEHDPRDLWRTSLSTARIVLRRAADKGIVPAALGIANQRETAVIWDRATGRPIHNAIVWQDRRTAAFCARLKSEGHEPLVQNRTGLLLDPYFSASKIAWLLDNVPGARARAVAGELAFGTVDSYLLWRLTNGAVHATDATNASRTSLWDLRKQRWDDDLLKLFGIPKPLLPDVQDTTAAFGTALAEHLGLDLPVCSMVGDQQAALIGQACFEPGMMKATVGTGAFVLVNTGDKPMPSQHRLLTTLAYRLKGKPRYALEGAIFAAGATVQWLRDGLGLLRSSAEAGQLAAQADPEQFVYIVPAFVGLGAPHWDAEARGTMIGITRGTTRREIARAALESVAFQARDLIEAMRADMDGAVPQRSALRVDGGMSASDWTMQSMADLIEAPVERAAVLETTARGAAYLAGYQMGLYPEPEVFATSWRAGETFAPAMDAALRTRKVEGWRDAVRRTLLTL